MPFDNSDLVEVIDDSCPRTMHDLIQSSKCDFTILESSDTCQKVEELKLPLMVMSRSRGSGKIPKLSHI